MANVQQVQSIRAALMQLDPQNDLHWTEDGAPQVAVVQELASDTTIKRTDIQMARPGFERATLAEPIEPIAPAVVGQTQAAAVASVEADGGTVLTADGGEISEAEARTSFEQEVKDAEDALGIAQKAVLEGNKAVRDAMVRLTQAREALTREFPPLTAAENIKQHLARQQEQRRLRIEGKGLTGGMSRLDLVHRRGNSRGWRKPSRGGLPTRTSA